MANERKIDLGDGYWLINDPYCCWISQESVYQDGKNKGKTYLKRVSGYHNRVEDAVISFVNKSVRTKKADSIETLIEEIKSLKSLVKSLNWHLRGGDDDEAIHGGDE